MSVNTIVFIASSSKAIEIPQISLYGAPGNRAKELRFVTRCTCLKQNRLS
jgi:hypothetical protein